MSPVYIGTERNGFTNSMDSMGIHITSKCELGATVQHHCIDCISIGAVGQPLPYMKHALSTYLK